MFKQKNAIGKSISTAVGNKVKQTVLAPINMMVDEQISDIVTTIGSFVIRSVRGKFQRSITFVSSSHYTDSWMAEALYGVLYKYNNIKKSSKLTLVNEGSSTDGTGLYYQLSDGTHNLKFRKWNILLNIQTTSQTTPTGRLSKQKIYTIICFDLDPEFVTQFERDMVAHRNALLKIKADSPTINVYQDYHEGDGWTYWEKALIIPKRPLSTVYLPNETKKQIIHCVNKFFASRDYYREHGIAHNLKILLYGPPGSGKDTIAKMIASEWNRNLYYITGGKNGQFIPQALTSSAEIVCYPLLLVSDIDKYPFLINEPDINLDNEGDAKDEKMKYKQCFANMINALDGIMSGEGRIIVMTTNHIEKFSNTLLRPGRIDLKLEIGYVNVEVFRKYVLEFYNQIIPEDIQLAKDNITIAEMQRDVVFMELPFGEFMKKYTK